MRSFREDLAQVTTTSTRSKAEAARGKSTEQLAQVSTPRLSRTTPSAPPLAPPLQPAEGAPPHAKSLSQSRRKAPSAEYPGLFPSMIYWVSEKGCSTCPNGTAAEGERVTGPHLGQTANGGRQTNTGRSVGQCYGQQQSTLEPAPVRGTESPNGGHRS